MDYVLCINEKQHGIENLSKLKSCMSFKFQCFITYKKNSWNNIIFPLKNKILILHEHLFRNFFPSQMKQFKI